MTDASNEQSNRLRVVFVAYYFPPMGGAGTQRGAAFVRRLPNFGIDPVVVCASERSPGNDTIAHDHTLLEDIDPSVPIIRVPSMESQAPTLRDRYGYRRATASSREIAWARRATDAAVFAARRHQADAIVVSVSPFACATFVDELRRRTDRPVLLDLRDPWALDGWRCFRTPVQPRLDRRRMRLALRQSDVVIGNCPAATEAFRRLATLDPGCTTTIPNGFEPDDFRHAQSIDPDDRRFRLVHVGTLHDPDPLRAARNPSRPHACGTLYRHLRSARTLLEATGRLSADDHSVRDQLRIDLIGRVHPGHDEIIRQLGLESIVHRTPYVDHVTVTRALTAADATFVPLHGMPAGEPALNVPGKLYESLGSGRPVLGALPSGDARQLVRMAGGDGRVIDPDDADGIGGVLATWLEAHRSGYRLEGAEPTTIAPFTRTALTARLAATIRAAIAGVATPADDPWIEARALAEARLLDRSRRPRVIESIRRRAA